MAAESHVEQITKIVAAQRQFAVAIRLFLNDGDMVAVHALSAAAHEVLGHLLKFAGKAELLNANPYVSKNFRKAFRGTAEEAKNFFKHANQDPNKEIDFNPHGTEVLLCEAV